MGATSGASGAGAATGTETADPVGGRLPDTPRTVDAPFPRGGPGPCSSAPATGPGRLGTAGALIRPLRAALRGPPEELAVSRHAA
ncbi:MAG: hypothetical protein M3350_07405, partial [Actinomycetota bacterium]|nr:hypothetical protein [Actinomycetota bacterium]